MRSVWEAHERERRRVIEANAEVAGSSLADDIRELEEQLLLASVKFLNPAQRYALTRDIAGDSNSDLPEDEDELREYLGDLRSPAGGGGRVVIDGFGGGRMPSRDEIQEIRINENSFTAEESRQGRGQTLIVTRGGTDASTATLGSTSRMSRSTPGTRSRHSVLRTSNEVSTPTSVGPSSGIG